jgi:hypothetical protein
MLPEMRNASPAPECLKIFSATIRHDILGGAFDVLDLHHSEATRRVCGAGGEGANFVETENRHPWIHRDMDNAIVDSAINSASGAAVINTFSLEVGFRIPHSWRWWEKSDDVKVWLHQVKRELGYVLGAD